MKLTSEMHRVLALINAALMKGDESALAAAFEGVDLKELLSQETIAVTRALGKKPMTLLLCTLAEQNEVEKTRARFWLDCYQSIVNGSLADGIGQLSNHHIAKFVVIALSSRISINQDYLSGKKLKGNPQAWQDALELLIDHKDWPSAYELLKHLGKKSADTEIWLQISKSLSRRHPLYVDESGQAQVDVDYSILAKIYGMCADAAHNAKVIPVKKALLQLAASALETGGNYAHAIEQLDRLDPGKKSLSIQLDMARCFCKKNQYLQSLEKLDRVLDVYAESQNADEITSNKDLSHDRPNDDGDHASFDIGKASQALSDLSRMANDKKTPVFLVSGTLLGYVREGQLLSHDKDIDVGIVGWENQYKLCMALQESGLFTVSAQYLKGKDTFYIPIKHNATGMWIDIFVYHEIQGRWVTGVDFFFGYRQTFAFTPFTLKSIQFLGVEMNVPENSELNLTENYGNWQKPDSGYISHLESPSTMDKGGLQYMITARLTLISACIKKQNLKVEKIMKLMGDCGPLAGAMNPVLMQKINSNVLKKSEPLQEVCHA
jgi:hypothetical protein